MTQHKFVLELGDRTHANQIAAALRELIVPSPDALTLFEDPSTVPPLWRIEVYYGRDEPDAGFLARQLADLVGIASPPLKREAVSDENWVALSQAALPPVTAGRYTIFGSHDRDRVPRGPNSILIDAGEAFGTAHHATTYGCLLAIDRLTRRQRPRNILDLGCGSAVLAIAAARAVPAASILATDIDRQSVVVAEANVRLNATHAQIRCLVSDGLANPAVRQRAPFDLVIANILAAPLAKLAPHITKAVANRGTLLLSGILNVQAPKIIATYLSRGFQLMRHDQYEGWSTLTLIRR